MFLQMCLHARMRAHATCICLLRVYARACGIRRINPPVG